MPVVMPGFSLESKMLHMTIWEDNLSGVENMLAAGADVNWPENHSGETPLIAALRRNNSEIVKRLLRVKSLRVSKADKEKMKEVAKIEANIYRFAELLAEVRNATVENVERKQVRNYSHSPTCYKVTKY